MSDLKSKHLWTPEENYEMLRSVSEKLKKSYANFREGKNFISKEEGLAWICEGINIMTEPLPDHEKIDIF
jgi:hypothetical protein